MKLSTKILIGLFAGILTGIFLGEYAQPLKYLGDAFIGLMQMTVMPIILLSLLSNLGKIKLGEQKKLISASIVVLVIFLVIGLATISTLPLFFPTWESSSFFSTSLITEKENIDFIDVYIPSNLFRSLTNNIVPAVVLFSILVGIGLNATPNNKKVIDALEVLSNALNKANKQIVKLTPYGIFGIAANTAGTLSLGELGLIQVYIGIYTTAVIVLGFILIPLLVSAVTPFRYKDFLNVPKSTLITIFATGKIIILLPQLIENINQLFEKYNEDNEEVSSSADLIMPLAYPFPNLGTLVIMVFVPFAAWFAGADLSVGDQVNFTTSSLLSSFVSPMVGIPFLLDTLHLPHDIFQLFIVSTAYTDRIRVVLGAIHLFGLSVIAIAYARGLVKINIFKIGKALAMSVAFYLILLLPMKLFIGQSFQESFDKHESFIHMDLSIDRVNEKIISTPGNNFYIPSSIQEIKEKGYVRVGYIPDALPYVFKNHQDKLVGYDVELMHHFAFELGVDIQWLEISRDSISASLNKGKIDLFASGVPVLPDMMTEINYSEPYSELNLSLIVPDHKRHNYKKASDIVAEKVIYGTNQTNYLNTLIEEKVPGITLKHIPSPHTYLEGETNLEAMFFSAEAGSAWTLIYPNYSVVLPEDLNIKLPVAWALAKNNHQLERYINQWLSLKTFDGTTSTLYKNWILGEATKNKTPRWSIMRDVLHWVK